MKLSDKIVGLRKSRGMSQEELAEKLYVSRQSISRWEMGSALPDATNILQIGKLFGVTTDYLLNDDYESDNDLPKIKKIEDDRSNQILSFLIIIELMIVLLEFMTICILKNVIFGILTFIPFMALVASFEYAYRKKAGQNNRRIAFFRKRFYKISVWLGSYFPIRLIAAMLMTLYPRPYSNLVFECVVLAIYLGTSLLANLAIEKHYIVRGKTE